MKRLTCEMCGSTDLIKQDGVFVCQSCGCKYSVEEAKKMMIEGTVEVTGTVQVDNSHLIQNYLDMAKNAMDAGNNVEAESYCNKVIEIDPNNCRAWMIKGESAAWQSTLQNSRIAEGVAAFSKGIANAPDGEKEELVKYAEEQIKRLSTAMISLRAERFAKWPDAEESTGFTNDLTAILTTVVSFLAQTGALIPISEIMAPVATQINQSVVKAWQNVVWPDYNGDPNDSDDRANKYEWQRSIERVGYCTTLVEKAINLCDDDDDEDIQRYENLIFMHKAAIDSCSWDYNITDWGKSWHKEWMLTDAAKSARRQLISSYEAKIREIKQAKAKKEAAEKAKKRNEYWAAHAEEKAALEAEREKLNQRIEDLEKKAAAVPGEDEIKALVKERDELMTQKNSLGLFKGKEKKALQDQIDDLSSQIKEIEQRMDAEKNVIKAEIPHLRERRTQINAELSKDISEDSPESK